MKKVLVLCNILMMSFLLSCGGGGGGEDMSECSKNRKNEFVYNILHDYYLWYNEVPHEDFKKYSSPEVLLESLKYKYRDKWSYITNADEYDQFYEDGKYIGFGFSFIREDNDDMTIRFVYKDSPADKAGMKRSDKVLTFNGTTFDDLSKTEYDNIFDDDIGEAHTFRIRSQDNSERTVVIAKEWVHINTVLHHEIMNVNDTDIGYLVFKSFIEPSEKELNTVFTEFKNNNVEELILDLRYNGGGRLSVAEHLGSLINSVITANRTFIKIKHNNKYTSYDEDIQFEAENNTLDLDRIIVLTTENTCSASETIINGMKPYIDVVVIGDETCGKPVGMYSNRFCDIVLLPIEFETVNVNGQGGYYNGISYNCYSEDDLTKEFGDIEEGQLKTALYFLANDNCPSVSAAIKATEEVKSVSPLPKLSGLKREIGAY